MDIVHVRDEFAGICRRAVVIAVYAPPPGSFHPELRLRVIRPSGLHAPGAADEEGTYRHNANALTVMSPNRPSGFRTLDSWHDPADADCVATTRRPAPARWA